MPGKVRTSTISSQLRSVTAIAVPVCVFGALFSNSELIPFHQALESSRTPPAATLAAQWLFLGSAFLFAYAFAAWHEIRRKIADVVQSITRWSSLTYLWSVCGLALGLRLIAFLLIPQYPLRTDALWYHMAATAIAGGHGLQPYGVPTAYRPPGYSILLALPYRLFGPHPAWAWFWGLVSTGILLLTTHHLAGQLYGKTTARIATLIIAFYPALILYTGQPMSDLVFAAGLMIVWHVVIIHPPYRWLQTVGIGIALGVLTLTRGVSIGLFLVVPLVWFTKTRDIKRSFFHFTLLTFAFVACLLPWTLRNYLILGAPKLTTNVGINLYIGNHAGASGASDVRVVLPALADSDAQFSEPQLDSVYSHAAIQFVFAHPLEALFALPKKILHFFMLEVSAAQLLFQDRSFWLKYLAYGITQLFYTPIAVLFAIRIINLRDANRRPHGCQWTGFILTVYFALMTMLFYGMDRYRLPLLPWMIIESSLVLAWLGTCPAKQLHASDVYQCEDEPALPQKTR